MSKHKFVCFECQQGVKRDFRINDDVRCSSCAKECVYLGVKIPIPPKSKPKEWAKLQHQLESEKIGNEQEQRRKVVTRIHELEKEIKKLEDLPENVGRLSLIKKLKKELSVFNA